LVIVSRLSRKLAFGMRALVGAVGALEQADQLVPHQPAPRARVKADDFRMRAVEAYILAQRKGTMLDYGKH
jgi:hypothetical protein